MYLAQRASVVLSGAGGAQANHPTSKNPISKGYINTDGYLTIS